MPKGKSKKEFRGREYWVGVEGAVPRKRLSLGNFLEGQGYEVNCEGDNYIKVGRVKLGRILENGEVYVLYENFMDFNHLHKILDLRKILDVNEVPYKEYPSKKELQEIIEEKRNEFVKEANSLIKRLKKCPVAEVVE